MTMQLVWTDSNGATTDLTNDGPITALLSVGGLDVAPRELLAADLVSTDGALLTQARYGRRYLTLPILFKADGTRVLDAIGTAARMFQGPGTLTYADDYNTRTLESIYYETGMEGDQSSDMGLTDQWRKVVVSLVALDPWWHGADQTILLEYGDPALFDDAAIDFDDVLMPFDGGSATAINVNGDAPAYPLLTLTGPMDAGAVVVPAGSGGIQLAQALGSGEVLTIDSRPGRRGPSWQAGQIDWSWLTPDSRLFTLPLGASVVAVGVSGDSGTTSFEMTYSERWLTP